MAHFAELDENNVVVRVVVVADEYEDDGENWCNTFFSGGTWKQTSYNNNIRKQFAGIGDTYDAAKDKFISPQPYASWSLDSNDDWQPPAANPYKDGGSYFVWNEINTTWEEVE